MAKVFITIILVGMGCFVTVIVGVPVTITLVNDATARSVESQLRALPLPEGAELLESTSHAAKLVGNGNGMQYLGALQIRSDENVVDLRTYYNAQTTADNLNIMVAPSGSLDDFHRASGFLRDPAEAGVFVVYAWGDGLGGLFERWDLRGR